MSNSTAGRWNAGAPRPMLGRMFKHVVIAFVAAATLAGASFSPLPFAPGPVRADDRSAAAPPVPAAPAAAAAAPAVPDASAAATTGVIARRVSISRLHINLPILQGTTTGSARERRAYHHPRSGWPGSGRSTYIYGHARAGTFINLWRAKRGDRVILTLKNGKKAYYTVYWVHLVKWNDSRWVYAKGEILALQTCVGRNPKGPRFMVLARRTK
jgi:LPXTG-site transpeptidase (sortase) family protein